MKLRRNTVATRKKTTTKKPAKATVKKTVAKKSTTPRFWRIEFSIATVYWLAIGIAVISTAIYSYNTNQQVNELYDQIDARMASEEY